MLLEFTVSNFRSIGEAQTLSLVPAPKQREYPENILTVGKHQALNAIALYGANASGKSNLLRAMGKMRTIIQESVRANSTDKLDYDPFLLRKGWNAKPTEFLITFVQNNLRYKYGFKYNQTEIVEESLYRKGTGREIMLFEREGETIEVSSSFKGADIAIEPTRNNALFLSTCDMFNVSEAKTILEWFSILFLVDGLITENLKPLLIRIIRDNVDISEFEELINPFTEKLGLGYKHLTLKEIEPSLREKRFAHFTNINSNRFIPVTYHTLYDENGNTTDEDVEFELSKHESSGTQKVFELAVPIMAFLIHGGVLVIDEIEAKMHPILTQNLIDLFLNHETNPKGAQLIFATHDTNLLSHSKLRRDQIYFVEKNEWESSEIYSLSDFVYSKSTQDGVISEKERPDTDKEKRYLEGRYGAIPVLGKIKQMN